jgi:hypothetical protein
MLSLVINNFSESDCFFAASISEIPSRGVFLSGYIFMA